MLKCLVDTSPAKMAGLKDRDLIAGQLITPLTGYANWGGSFGIDNGAFSGFDMVKFRRLQEREEPNKSRCLFLVVPDVVGNGRLTLDLFRHRERFLVGEWPLALVAQNGIEDLDIPWEEIACLFLGGKDPWKDSQAAAALVTTAKALGKHVHIGRLNTVRRYRRFNELGADTCDGSGVAMYDHMLEKIERVLAAKPAPTLFELSGKRHE